MLRDTELGVFHGNPTPPPGMCSRHLPAGARVSGIQNRQHKKCWEKPRAGNSPELELGQELCKEQLCRGWGWSHPASHVFGHQVGFPLAQPFTDGAPDFIRIHKLRRSQINSSLARDVGCISYPSHCRMTRAVQKPIQPQLGARLQQPGQTLGSSPQNR